MDAQLRLKIEQMYHALGQARHDDLSVIKPVWEVGPNFASVYVDARQGRSDAALANVLTLLITNIACLHDHFRRWCKQKGVQRTGECLIDRNPDVAVIYDLWNLEKHGGLGRESRSKRFPRLTEIGSWVESRTQARAGSVAGMTMSLGTGQLRPIGDGTTEVIVTANVVDSGGKLIGDLLEIARRAVEAWEQELRSANVPMPPL